jgi:hypothetical protein
MTAPDPMRSFRGVIAATLGLEGVVILLAWMAAAKLGDGLTPGQAIVVAAFAVVHFGAIGFAGRPWALMFALCTQAVMIIGWLLVTALGVVGVIFGVAWAILWWFRHDVAKRMAQGRLPSQQG